MVGLIVLLVASACRVDTTVDIRVDDDGSGRVAYTVVANADAVSLLVDDPTDLRFDDLAAAGWNLDGPIAEGGGVTITASKPFLSPEELPGLLDELIGEGVVFSNVALEQAHDFSMLGLRPAETSYDFVADVDPAPDLEILGDAVIEGLLGSSLGRSLTRVEEDAGGSFAGSLGLVVNVQLPANVATDSELGETVDNVVTWEFSYGDAPTTIDARASIDEILPRVWSLVAILAALLFVLVVLSRLATFVIVKLRTPKGRRRRDQRQREKRAATRAAEANRPRRRLLRLLIVDVHGVLVRPTDPVEDLLIPLVTAERPDADPERIRELPGLHPFLDRMATSRLPVAAVGNQPRVWGDRLRRMASLDSAIASWMVSGDVGSGLPEPALFEATRRTMSVDLYDCFYLSNNPEHLDTAKELGMATGLFVTGNEAAPETEHPIVRGFEDLLRSRGS